MHVRTNKVAKFPGRIITKVGGKRQICGEKEGEEGWCISRRVRGMLLSGVISMGIGGPAPDCFIFKVYFRRWYIY